MQMWKHDVLRRFYSVHFLGEPVQVCAAVHYHGRLWCKRHHTMRMRECDVLGRSRASVHFLREPVHQNSRVFADSCAIATALQ